jgi:acid phosphatase class B
MLKLGREGLEMRLPIITNQLVKIEQRRHDMASEVETGRNNGNMDSMTRSLKQDTIMTDVQFQCSLAA